MNAPSMFLTFTRLYSQADPQRWAKIASLLPSKTEADVERRYQKLMMDVVRIELGEAGGRVGSS